MGFQVQCDDGLHKFTWPSLHVIYNLYIHGHPWHMCLNVPQIRKGNNAQLFYRTIAFKIIITKILKAPGGVRTYDIITGLY